MATNRGQFIIDKDVSGGERERISKKVLSFMDNMKTELSTRGSVIKKRIDFFDGDHHKWTNVYGQSIKRQEGRIVAVFNYINRFCRKIVQVLTNSVPRIKIVPRDESDDVEVSRAEAVEQAIYDVLKTNKFFSTIFKKLAINQVRDGDFMLECKVLKRASGEQVVEIKPMEDLTKISVGWDDATGTSFSFIAYTDLWTLEKIRREFGYEAESSGDAENDATGNASSVRDEYGIFSGSESARVPSGDNKLPKARVTDYWGYEVIGGEVVVVNLVYINKDLVQFIKTDYKKIPRFIGHSFVIAGKPWSQSFIDPLIDPQIELNDRTGEEGDMIRAGSNLKYVVVNMPDFDANSIKTGTGQCIFIEGEGADFRPLPININPFPSGDYINRVMEHLYNLGLPKIALAAGTAPYTGKVGAIQYQSVVDIISDLRIQWEVVLEDLIKTIQEYLIAYFPETHAFLREHTIDEITGEGVDGELIVRDVEFDWENVLPLSRSDKVVDASTMRDRNAISLYTYLEEAGFRDPGKEIKKLKKEAKDEELMVLTQKFNQYAPGVVQAQLDAQRKMVEQEESNADMVGSMEQAGSQKSTPPILNQSQNDGKRGVLTGAGTPTGQTATQKGLVNQTTQNANAKAGV